MIRCILSTIPSDFTARWSAGANILAFIPTIVALLSNSIHEVAATADESIVLAVALSLSSVTAFISRFGHMPLRASETFFGEKDENRKAERLRGIWEKIEKQVEKIKGQGRTPWWWHRNLNIGVLYILLLALSAGIWYEIYETTRYGVIVNACPIKVNVGLWVGLSQLLTLLNVVCRKFAFDIRTVEFKSQNTPISQAMTPRGRPAPSATAAQKRGERSVAVILRSPRNTFLRWALQTFTAIASFTLYTFGTVVLASITLIPASDAIRTLAVLTIGAGVGRLVGYWKASPLRTGSRIIIVDVPADYMKEFFEIFSRQPGVCT